MRITKERVQRGCATLFHNMQLQIEGAAVRPEGVVIATLCSTEVGTECQRIVQPELRITTVRVVARLNQSVE